VGPHVEGVPLVLFHAHAVEQLGTRDAEDAGGAHHLEGARRRLRLHRLQPLVADALGADLAKRVERWSDGGEGVGVELELEGGAEARRAQDTQAVLRKALEGLAHRAEALVGEVLPPVERVDERAVLRVHRDGVDREVSPREIGHDVIDEVHRIGSAPVGVGGLAAQRRDLVVMPAHDHGDRAVLESRGDRARKELHQLVGQRIGSDVPVGDLLAEQGIPHATTDDPRALPCPAEPLADGERVLRNRCEIKGVRLRGHGAIPIGQSKAGRNRVACKSHR
jgi:hypothetical protein